jgi:hypothetical protein
MTVKRFYYAQSPRTSTLHMLYKTEHLRDQLTACGRPVTTDWKLFPRLTSASKICRQCENAS